MVYLSISVIFHFFHQHPVVFRVQVFCLLRFILRYFILFDVMVKELFFLGLQEGILCNGVFTNIHIAKSPKHKMVPQRVPQCKWRQNTSRFMTAIRQGSLVAQKSYLKSDLGLNPGSFPY